MNGVDQYSDHINPHNLTPQQESDLLEARAIDKWLDMPYEEKIETSEAAGVITEFEAEYYLNITNPNVQAYCINLIELHSQRQILNYIEDVL